jgi:hypothetical protein
MQTFLVDDGDSYLLSMKWSITREGYARLTVPLNGERFIHRIIAGAQPGEEVDHIDRNTLNNKRSNLRIATRQQQGFNRGLFKNNTTGYKGVSFHRGKWQASIRVNGILEYLGRFTTPEKASEAYQKRLKEL